MEKIRCRFAPSPTGHLHIGSARVALFNYLFAKNKGGKFILRIEDTDIKRSSEDFTKSIIDDLNWLQIFYDEGPYFQKDRASLYKKYIDELIRKGFAYIEDSAVKFKIENRTVEFEDNVRGKIRFESKNFEDFVILKKDGTPTYNFACVVDDRLMEISHIIRGDDHITNTARQILIYSALNFELPNFSHLPMICGEDKQRLSKRHGAKSIRGYRDEGYLIEGLINYLARLSWSYDDKTEIFSIDELIEKFSIEKISKGICSFDEKKLLWFNSYYIKNKNLDELTQLIIPYLRSAKYEGLDDFEYIKKVVKIFQERITKLSDIISATEYIFLDDIKIQDTLFDIENNFIKNIKEVSEYLNKLEDFNDVNIEKILRRYCEDFNIDRKKFFQTIRILTTGRKATPPLFILLELIGKEKVVKRLLNYHV